jgi:general secretion pathway protein L
MTRALLVTSFPAAAGEPLHWWHLVDGAVMRRGVDSDPRAAAGLTDLRQPLEIIALLPSTAAVTRWTTVPLDLTDAQKHAIARKEAVQAGIGGSEQLHAASQLLPDGRVVTCYADSAVLTSGLAVLRAVDIDPARLIPAGLAIPLPENMGQERVDDAGHWVLADWGFERLLRGADRIIPDEPGLRTLLVGDDAPITAFSGDALDAALAALPDYQGPDLRSGAFRRRASLGAAPQVQRWLVMLVAALLLLSLAIPLVRWAKLEWSASAAESRALTIAQQQFPDAADLAAAEAAIDAQLVAQGKGSVVFAVPAAALFAAVQQAPKVSLGRLDYQRDGTIRVRMLGPDNGALNAVLIALQNQGYTVTAAPATDPAAPAAADISVRGY